MKVITLCCNSCQNYFRFEAGSFEDMRGTICDDCAEEAREQAECAHIHFFTRESESRCETCGYVEAA